MSFNNIETDKGFTKLLHLQEKNLFTCKKEKISLKRQGQLAKYFVNIGYVLKYATILVFEIRNKMMSD